MGISKVSNQEILNGLMSVFRTKGYDGASLNELAEATGLKKASLYHRFPRGKREMTDAVLDYMDAWVANHIYGVLTDDKTPLKKRLVQAIENINTVYQNGRQVCLYRSLSMDSAMTLFGKKIEKGINQWLEAFGHFGEAVGLDEKTASAYATQSFIEIQGSLVLSKAIGDTKPFKDTVAQIEKRYGEQ